jgi:AcrR family transcriptional regulator
MHTAARVICEKGYEGTSIQDIADACHLTKAGVYHYFVAKQEILDVICDAAMAATERVISDGLRRPGSPARRLERMAEQYADLALSYPGLLVFIRHFDDLSDVMQGQMRKRGRRLAAMLRHVIDEGVAEGVFEAPNSAIAVLGLFGSVNWTQSWYNPDGRLARGTMRDLLVSQVMRGVLAPAER